MINTQATPSIPLNHKELTDEAMNPKGRSIAHHNIHSNKLAYISSGIETGGEYCGILQLPAEIVRIELVPKLKAKGESIYRKCFYHQCQEAC